MGMRRHRWKGRGLLLTACGLLLTGCGSSISGPPTSPEGSATTPATAGQQAVRSMPSPHDVALRRPLRSPQVAVTAAGVYVAWQVPARGSVVRSELARVDMATGRIEAVRRLGTVFDDATAAAGELWVTTSSTTGVTLLRLNPDTLTATGRWRVGTAGGVRWAAQVLAVAGGGLWVAGGNRLLHLSLPAGRVMASITLAGAASSDLSSNAAGSILVVGEADSGGRGAVQRRDPVTGALLASHPVLGVAAPAVAGPVGSSVWVSEATGMMGYVQQLDVTTMTADASDCEDGRTTATCVEGTNGITARLASGLLWISQPVGGNARNYCADPASGREVAPFRLPQPNQDEVLAISAHRIIYAAPGPKAGQYVRDEAVPAACRSR
jgi:hypothetical protein